MSGVETLRATIPGAVKLATLGSIAARLESPLIRELRLELAPELDVADEADLWFSDLVEVRAATGLVLAPDAVQVLRAELARDRDVLDLSWEVTKSVHAKASPALLVEEELIYLTLSGLNDADNRRRAERLLRELVATLVDEERQGTVTWADRALTRFPPELFSLEEARMLAVGTAFRSGRAHPNVDMHLGDAYSQYRWLRPPVTPTGAFGIRLVEDGVEIGRLPLENGHAIDLPPIRPVLIDLVWNSGGVEQQQTLRYDEQDLLFEAVNADVESVEVRVRGGDDYRLDAERKRPRAPRVQIEYDNEVGGAEVKVELPFVIGVMADLSGYERASIANRRFVEADGGSLQSLFQTLAPLIHININLSPILDADIRCEFSFRDLRDFEPPWVSQQLQRNHPYLLVFLEIRGKLQDLWTKADSGMSVPEVRDSIMNMQIGNGEGADYVRDVIEEVLNLESLDIGGLQSAIQHAIATLDRAYGDVIDRVLHHEEFKVLEAAWRGLSHLLERVDGEFVKARVMDVSKSELVELQQRFAGSSVYQGPLAQQILEEPYGTFGGEPYGLLVADFYVGDSEDDVELLRWLGEIAASAQAPVLAGAAPEILGVSTWGETVGMAEIEIPFAVASAWQALRSSDDARYIQLCMPRFLAREPHTRHTYPASEFVYDERFDFPAEDAVWSNAAFAMAGNIAQAYHQYGWPARIRGVESGGAVEGLPIAVTKSLEDADEVISVGPTEIAITDRREIELANLGFSSLLHRPKSDFAGFIGAQSLNAPEQYDDPDATANAELAARLPYTMAVSRFAHYVRCVLRDKAAGFRNPEDAVRWVNNWLLQYIDGDPMSSTEFSKARKPLSAAEFSILWSDSSRQTSRGELFLRPHYQLEGLTASIRVVLDIPDWGWNSDLTSESGSEYKERPGEHDA